MRMALLDRMDSRSISSVAPAHTCVVEQCEDRGCERRPPRHGTPESRETTRRLITGPDTHAIAHRLLTSQSVLRRAMRSARYPCRAVCAYIPYELQWPTMATCITLQYMRPGACCVAPHAECRELITAQNSADPICVSAPCSKLALSDGACPNGWKLGAPPADELEVGFAADRAGCTASK